jgi:two-component system, chemotaxis family, response regulator Rcp1
MYMMDLGDERLVEILLVEDNLADIRLTQEVFKEGKVRNQLSVVRNGEEALAFLRQEGHFASVLRPDMILLDLNLPRKDGRAVLAEIKADPDLKRIPVIILTTSQAESDLIQTYNLHANCYIVKPVELDQFIEAVKRIQGFWLQIVKLPPNGEQ